MSTSGSPLNLPCNEHLPSQVNSCEAKAPGPRERFGSLRLVNFKTWNWCQCVFSSGTIIEKCGHVSDSRNILTFKL